MKEHIAKIRAWHRERFPSLQFTQQDIESVLSMAARRVRQNSVVKENLTTDGDMRFALRNFPDDVRLQEAKKLAAFENAFFPILNDFENNNLPKDKVFELGATPDAFTMLGVQQLPISISGSVVHKAKEKHNLTVKELKQIPYSLYNPVMIFESSDRSTNFQNGMVVVTQILDSNKKPIIIALNIEKTNTAHKINDIASIYGKNNVHQIIDWIKEGFLKYSHRNRALAFARFHRLSLPKKATISEGSNNTIIDESPEVKSENENNEEIKFSDLSDGSDNSDGGDLRFLLSEYSEEQTSDIVAILRPFVGYYLVKEDAEQKLSNYLIFPRITHIAGRVGPSRRFSGGPYQLARKCRRRKAPPNAHAHKPYPAPTDRQPTDSGGCFHSRQSPYNSVPIRTHPYSYARQTGVRPRTRYSASAKSLAREPQNKKPLTAVTIKGSK